LITFVIWNIKELEKIIITVKSPFKIYVILVLISTVPQRNHR
jgi:hypothetical protein